MNLVNIPGLRQGFDLRSFTECERSLGEISTKPQTEERVGYSLVERKEVIQLGDFLIGSCWKNTELYTTEHDAVRDDQELTARSPGICNPIYP